MKPISILYLYPDEMSFYGDIGNVLCLKKRLEWRGLDSEVHLHGVGHKLPSEVDIVVGGGGQDEGQSKVHADLMTIADAIKKLADNGTPMLMVCGMYQLFGHRFLMQDGSELKGISVFDMETVASDERLIGNVVSETAFGQMVGFENHSGQTFLATDQPSLGKIKIGYGNDASRQNEGAVYKNVYGTYLHGAVLPKNPRLADELIRQALVNRGMNKTELEPIKEALTSSIHQEALKRPQ